MVRTLRPSRTFRPGKPRTLTSRPRALPELWSLTEPHRSRLRRRSRIRPDRRHYHFDVRFPLLLGLGAVLVVSASSALAKPGPDGLPGWLAAKERDFLATTFPHGRLVLVSHRPSRDEIAVVFEFQDVVLCRMCTHPRGASAPHGRVVRVTFDRSTRRRTGPLRFCEIDGVKPPLSTCLDR